MSFDIAAAANFLRHKFREVVAPVFDCIERQHLNRIAELSSQEVGNDGLDVSSLSIPGDIVWRMWPVRFDNHIDRLIGPEGDNGRKFLHCLNSNECGFKRTARRKFPAR